jgi:hypothetical protein
MIYLYIYLLLNLFATIQINIWVKMLVGDWETLVECIRITSESDLSYYSNKQIISAISFILFVAGIFVLINVWRDSR